MIQEFRIKNFYSFRDETVLDFRASKDSFAEDSQVVECGDERLLRYAIVYGYNASGKSNLLLAIDFLKEFWSYRPDSLDEGTGVTPFRLDRQSRNEPTVFGLIFFVGSVKYKYELELDKDQVYLEKLAYLHNGKMTDLFVRTFESGSSVIQFNDSDEAADRVSPIVSEAISVKCLKNTSFFVARNQVNTTLPLIDAAKEWLRNGLMPVIYPSTSLTMYAERKSNEDEKLNGHILNFLRTADFNVTHISTNVVDKTIPDDAIDLLLEDDDIPKNERERIKKERTIKQLRTHFVHTVETENGKESYQFVGSEESLGTMRVFGLEAALYTVMQKNGFLPIDEIETSLHPKLIEKVLYEYLRVGVPSQILIATHEDGLLDLVDDLIRKDAVWFTDKGKNGVTELYRLTDFRGLNRLSSFREAYRNKRFGATMK